MADCDRVHVDLLNWNLQNSLGIACLSVANKILNNDHFENIKSPSKPIDTKILRHCLTASSLIGKQKTICQSIVSFKFSCATKLSHRLSCFQTNITQINESLFVQFK